MHQFIILCLFRGAEETDLIYEGIETHVLHCFRIIRHGPEKKPT